MGVKNDKFKSGGDWTEEGLRPTLDLNPTIDAIIDLIGVGIAQNAYMRTLEKGSSTTNQDYLFSDVVSDSNGVNNTVNTGSSTGVFDNLGSSYYYLNYNTDRASGDTTSDPDSFTSPSNAFDNDDGTAATKSVSAGTSASLGKTFGAATIKSVYIKSSMGTNGNFSKNMKLQSYNGSTWDDELTLASGNGAVSFTGSVNLDKSVQGLRILFTNGAGGSASTSSLFTLEYDDAYATSGTVIIDSNTTTLDGTEESIVVYADKTLPTNTTLTVDITDGTTTLSAQPLDTVIGLAGFSSGTLSLTFNLGTSDTSVTPTLKGYGVYIN